MRCKKCGNLIGKGSNFCTVCGAKASKEHVVIRVFGGLIVITLGISLLATAIVDLASVSYKDSKIEMQAYSQKFVEDCPLEITAKVEENIIGFPELVCDIKNVSGKNVQAFEFYFIPRDVYGERISNFIDSNYLNSDKLLEANKSKRARWSFLDRHVKKGELYLYSVTFEDGTSWGDREAGRSQIKQYGKSITVSYEK